MTPRLDLFKAAPAAMKAMVDFSLNTPNSVEHSLQELVKMRASQINGCARCLHMHALDARKAGETEMRLYLLDAWRESPLYSDRERAALAWTEALTVLSETRHVSDEVYAALKAQFTDREQVELTMLIVNINSWNRINCAFQQTHPVETRAAA